MKKLLAILLALLLVLVNVAALAEGGDENTGMPELPGAANDVIENEKNGTTANASGDEPFIKKTYSTNVEGVYPTETLRFQVTPEEDSYPEVTVGNNNTFATTGENAYTIPVNVPAADRYGKAGMYHYSVKELAPVNPSQGATYDTEKTFNVDVYVYYDKDDPTKLVRHAAVYSGLAANTDTKDEEFENSYSVGVLTVTKEITGNLADPEKEFTIEITLTASNTVNNVITIANNAVSVTGEGVASGNIATGWTGSKKITMTAKGGQSITLNNIPTDVTYTVAETGINVIEEAAQMEHVNDDNAYSVSYVGESGTISSTTAASATVTNNKDITVPTGIALDSIPYVLIMSLAVIALVALKARKREEF